MTILFEIIDADDVMMRELKTAFRLMLEFVQRCLIDQQQIGQEFERYLPLQLLIAREPYDTHTATAND